jgi:hypothetical protein
MLRLYERRTLAGSVMSKGYQQPYLPDLNPIE